MQEMQVTATVTKEAYELGQGLKNFTAAMHKALQDGFQVGQDVPVILTSALSDLIPAFQGVQNLGEEVKDTEAFINSVSLGLSGVVSVFIKKDPA